MVVSQDMVKEHTTLIQELRSAVQRQEQEQKKRETEQKTGHQECCYPHIMIPDKAKA